MTDNSDYLYYILLLIVIILIIVACVQGSIYCSEASLISKRLNVNSKVNKIDKFSSTESFKIDAVYTWAGEQLMDENIPSNRVRNNGELQTSLTNLKKFLPWINKIYVIMNNPKKRPEWMDPDIVLLDHTEVFPKDKLREYITETGNKNSEAIETTIHRIPDLEEHFIYFNDDIIPMKYCSPSIFFTPDGKIKLLNEFNMIPTKNFVLNNPETNKIIKTPEKIKTRFVPHVALPLLKSVCQKTEQEYSEMYDFIRRIKKRTGNAGCDMCFKLKLACPCMQFQGYIIPLLENQIVYEDYYYRYLNDDTLYILEQILNLKDSKKYPYMICVNDIREKEDQEVETKKKELFKRIMEL